MPRGTARRPRGPPTPPLGSWTPIRQDLRTRSLQDQYTFWIYSPFGRIYLKNFSSHGRHYKTKPPPKLSLRGWSFCVPTRTRTQNAWAETKNDIHFTIGTGDFLLYCNHTFGSCDGNTILYLVKKSRLPRRKCVRTCVPA